MGEGAYARVSRRDPCPVCGKADWCRVFADGGVECMRTESPVTCSSGGWMHWPNKDWRDQIKIFPEKTVVTEMIPESCLDHVYRKLLAQFPPNAKHATMLRDRGLESFNYGSLPFDEFERESAAFQIANVLPNRLWLDRTPGFYRTQMGGNHWSIAGQPGLLIPIRNAKGYIVGMQIRKNEGDPRYSFLSSRGMLSGTGSGSPVHVRRGNYNKTCIITEGPLKADYVHQTGGQNVIAVPGVNNIRGVLPALKEMGVTEAIVAYDMDWKTNKQVKAARSRLMQMLWCEGYRVSSFSWDPTYKGIDDAMREEVEGRDGCPMIQTDYDPDGAVPCSRLFDAA